MLDEQTPALTGESAASDTGAEHESQPRRNFIVEGMAAAIGGLVALVPLLAGVTFFFDPLLRKKSRPPGHSSSGGSEADEGFIKVATVRELPADGRPVVFTVKRGYQDAWNYIADQEVGTVFLRKLEDGSIIAFNTRCPHLGCTIEFRSGHADFFCPCHTSTFDLDGQKLNPIPPRHMDGLEVKEVDGDVLVRFQKFRAGTLEQIPVA